MMIDTIVIGGGIMGAAAAYGLAKRGQAVLLLDQYEPGHAHGSSHGDGRIVRFNYTEAIYVELAMLAYPAWEALSAAAGEPLIQRTGLIEYGPADSQPVAESEANLQRYGLTYESLSAEEANQRFPQFHFAPGSKLIYQADGAVGFATKAVQALWRLVQEAGGETRSGTRIQRIEAHDDSVTVHSTDGERWHAKKLILAAGGWTKSLAAQIGLDLPLVVTQEVVGYFRPVDDVDHRVGTMPCIIDYVDSVDVPYYGLPQVDIPGIKAGWHHSGTVIEPDDARPEPTQAQLQALTHWMQRAFPHVEKQPSETVTCLYTSTPDHHFILDRHPQHSHIVIGAGFSGHGFKFGSAVGEILAQLALGETPPIALETFSLRRFDDPGNLDKRLGA